MREKIVLIGAGSASFMRGLVADLVLRGEECDLCLVDIDSTALDVAERLAAKMIEIGKAPLRIRASTDRRALLKDATAVICTIGVGGRRAWEQDVFIPRKYGIFQPVGDSVMPGGTSRALRMIPAMVDIAKDVLDLAPSALFFNYGNPMGPVCRAVRKATGANIVGLCHGVFSVANDLARILSFPPEQLSYNAVGVNHLTWFTEIRANGVDQMPKLRKIAAEQLAHPATCRDNYRFSWELLLLFNALPAVLDRHVTEFFPHLFRGTDDYYGKTLGVNVHSVEQVIASGDEIFDEMRERAFSAEPLPADYLTHIGGEHEQVIEIIDSIRNDRGIIYSANFPNRGQVPNLPAEAIVESPAVADSLGLRAIVQPPLPPGLAGTLATRLMWVEITVDAALEGSREKFVQALLLDGSVSSMEQAYALADELLAEQAAYLPQFKKP